MEGNCPQCRVKLELPHSGAYQCERCRTRFEVVLGFPRPLHPAAAFPTPGFGVPPPAGFAGPPLPPPTIPAGGDASCAAHPGSPAQFVCERCGDFMCRLCATPIEGRLYCPRCFDLLYSRGALHLAQRQFNLPGVAFGLGLGGFLVSLAGCSCVSLVASFTLGLGGVWTGIRALKEIGQRPELPGRGLTIAGITLAGLAILVSIGWVVFWIWTFSQRS